MLNHSESYPPSHKLGIFSASFKYLAGHPRHMSCELWTLTKRISNAAFFALLYVHRLRLSCGSFNFYSPKTVRVWNPKHSTRYNFHSYSRVVQLGGIHPCLQRLAVLFSVTTTGLHWVALTTVTVQFTLLLYQHQPKVDLRIRI